MVPAQSAGRAWLNSLLDVHLASIVKVFFKPNGFTTGIAPLLEIDGYSDISKSSSNILAYTVLVHCNAILAEISNIVQ